MKSLLPNEAFTILENVSMKIKSAPKKSITEKLRSFTIDYLKKYMMINCFNKFGENTENDEF